jgi:glycosyltransferase involved in cell wall biosynthesis
MKIMFVLARLNIGGAALNVIQMAHALNQLPGVETVLVHGQVGPDEGDMVYLTDQYQVRRVEVASLGRELSPLRDLKTMGLLYRLMRQERPDVVNTHTAKAGWVGRWAALMAGVGVRVHTFQGHVFSGYFSPRKTQLFLFLECLAARISTRIATVSPHLRTELAQTYHIAPLDKIVVMIPGLNLQPFTQVKGQRGALRQQAGFPPESIVIGVVGRLVPIKNHALFLQAATLLHAQRPEVRFALVGDGELRSEIEAQIAELGLQGAVYITGWVQDMARLYGDLDIVTISSNNEGMPVSLLEGIAAQIPVVSTAVGGATDLLQPDLARYLVPPGDAEALCAAWIDILDHPPEMKQPQARILAQYDLPAVAQIHLAFYRQLLAEVRR